MKRAKTIDEIYDEVRDYDLVITNDAALATALNSRIDRPFIGYFATTPKMLASNLGPEILGEGIHKELRVIGEICDETGYQFKFVHGEVRNIKEIRKYTARVSDHMHTKRSRRIFDSFDSLPTLERAMSSFDTESSDFFKDRPRVAVIGIDLFNDLDKHFVPWEHDEIDPFTEDRFTIERIYEIGNDRQVAENAVDLIDPEHAEDYAIILDTSSPMTDAVRASLYRKGIPFVNNLNVRDLTQIRDYLQFLRLSLQYPTLRVKHVKELFSNYNGKIRPGREEFLLLKQDKDHMSSKAWVMNEAMRSIEDLTFDDVVGILDNPGTVQIRMLLSDMGLIGEKVTATAVSDLVYAVDNVEDLRHNEEIPVNERTAY